MLSPARPQGDTGPDVATLTLTETARLLRVHTATVRRWIEGGRLPAWQASPGGRYRIARSEVEALLRTRELAA